MKIILLKHFKTAFATSVNTIKTDYESLMESKILMESKLKMQFSILKREFTAI